MSSSNPTGNTTILDNNEFSNRVALAALILGGGAFIATFLQTVLAYITADITSGDRKKCLFGAIGDWSIYTRTSWDILRWRIRVHYPRYDLNIFKALESRDKFVQSYERLFSLYLFKNEDAGFRDISKVQNLRWWHVWYGTTCLVSRGDPVPITTLPLKLALRWLWFLFIHGDRLSGRTARASWVNMLNCLGAVPTEDSFLGMEPADTIPSGLDAPLQRTSLHNIGLWCFALGLKDVIVNADEGIIKGVSRHARLFTKPSLNSRIGNVISLEGDFETLRFLVGQPRTGELVEVVSKANGMIDFVTFRVHPYMFDPFRMVYGLLKGWNSETWMRYRALRIGTARAIRGNLISEAEQWQSVSEGKPPEWTAFWQGLGVGSCPSLLQTFSFLPYHSIWSGFPISSYLGPYLSNIATQRESWWASGGKEICAADESISVAVSSGDVPFLRVGNPFLLVTSDISETNGARTWVCHPCQERLHTWNTELYKRIVTIDRPLPVPRIVYRLLDGEQLEWLRRETIEQEFRFPKSQSLESSIWFSLYILEAKILHVWCQVEPDGTFGRLEQEFDKLRAARVGLSVLNKLENTAQFWLTSRLAEFLGLWLTMCGTAKESSVNPFDNIDVVERCFDRTLDSWKGEDEPCLPKLPDDDRYQGMDNKDAPLLGSKGAFYTWTEEEERRRQLRSLIPLLQLRAYLIYFSLLCCGDSSSIANLEFKDMNIFIS